eukprot:TRINITY_DN18525_c0_g1_i2.p4 TRINITY_DN18525_c0_g1~~TRINITY_DN18525_c0_g1_i2.p4  ORF type:complete len:104 (-),score=14.64 TRINITY_DN18525_c0_g1_i2:113-424(-)
MMLITPPTYHAPLSVSAALVSRAAPPGMNINRHRRCSGAARTVPHRLHRTVYSRPLLHMSPSLCTDSSSEPRGLKLPQGWTLQQGGTAATQQLGQTGGASEGL